MIEGTTILVCLKIEQGPAILGPTNRCFHCESVVMISPASKRAFESHPGAHRIVCATCYLMNMEYRSAEIQPPTMEQLAEVAEAIKDRL